MLTKSSAATDGSLSSSYPAGIAGSEPIDQVGTRTERGSNLVEPFVGDIGGGHGSPGNAGGSFPCATTLVGSV